MRKAITISLDDESLAKLDRLGVQHETNRSETIRALIDGADESTTGEDYEDFPGINSEHTIAPRIQDRGDGTFVELEPAYVKRPLKPVNKVRKR